jgi:hypothetical protein
VDPGTAATLLAKGAALMDSRRVGAPAAEAAGLPLGPPATAGRP